MVGASFRANGGPSASENRAHRPGGDGESSPGGVRSLLLGQWGAICFGEPGAPAWGDGESSPGGVRSLLPGQGGAISFREPGAPAWGGGTGSPAQGVFGASCKAYGGPSLSEDRAHRPGGDGESCPGGVRSLVPCLGGAIFFREPGAPARGGRGVLPRGCSESPARPMGGHLLQRTGRTGPGGTGSPAQGVFGVSCQANGGPSSSENRGHRPGGGRGVLPRGCSESPARPVGGHLLQRTGRTGPGGTGSLAKGVFGVSCKAGGGPSSSENRAHRPGGDGESCPGGVRSLLPRPMGGHLLQRTGRTGLGGTGSPAQGVFGVSCKASGGPSSSENRAHRPGGDGESCPGGVRSLLPGQWGAIFFREPGAPARGGRGVLPRGCSESPARPMGGHLLQRTGRTGPGGTGSPAQGVFGASCQGQWGAIFFREPGAPAWGGRGVLPRVCSEPPARPVGGQYLRRTGRTGLGGTGSPAQGVFGASGRTRGYSLLPLSSSRQVSRQYRGS